MTSLTWNDLKKYPPAVLAVGALVALAVFASYAEELWRVAKVCYSQSDTYGHAFIVPFFAGWLLWLRRDMMAGEPDSEAFNGGFWLAWPFFAAWALIRWLAVYLNYGSLDAYSLIPCLLGIMVWVGGMRALRWAWPSIVFLLFMIPLPLSLSGGMSYPLQLLATKASVFLLQTMGVQAVAQGAVIQLTNEPLEVAQACNGLKMLMMFFAICAGAAFVLKGPMWEKLVIVTSALPIAVISNVSRVTATALQREFYSREWLNEPFHGGAGLAMMPLALLLLWGEMVLLRKLFPEEVEAEGGAMDDALFGAPQGAGAARKDSQVAGGAAAKGS